MTEIALIPLIIYTLASYRVTRFFVQDTLFTPLRERIWKRFPPENTNIGYLFTCYWCMGFWISLLSVIALLFAGTIGLAVASVFAISALVGLIQAHLER